MMPEKRVKVPTILQMEALECGAASLAMVLGFYGKYIPLEELRIACGVSRDGSKASNVLKAARRYGLEAKGYRKEPESLKEMDGPMIIHWNFNHFLVLEGFKNGKVYLNDPGSGPRVVDEEEFDQSFTGIVLTFNPGPDFEKSGSKPSMAKALKNRIQGSKIALIYIILIGLALVMPGLVIPLFSKIFVDDVLLANKQNWLIPLILGMGITAVLRGLLTWIQEYYLLRLKFRIALSTSGQFLWHVLRLPVEFFNQRSIGDISSRMQSNQKVAELLSGELATTALNLIMIVFYLALMLQYNVVLSLVGVAAAALNILYLKFIYQKRVDLNRKYLQDYGKLMGTSMSGLQIIETLKATGSESDFFSKWSGYQAKVLNAKQQLDSTTIPLLGVPTLLTTLTNTAILALGGYYVLNGQMTIGMVVAFQSLMLSFMQPVIELVNLGSRLQEMEGDMNRLDDVLRYPIDECTSEEVDTEQSYEKLSGLIEIENLSFGYSPLEPPLIEDFNLKLQPGSRVALVGGSGSGKSTVAKLVAGIYKPWSGEILFDGFKSQHAPRPVINQSLSMVDQDINMFEGTIKENITLWDDTIPETDIVRAAKDASIHDDITSRVGGYEHLLDEGGSNFSGGQRQRLEIARALVNNPSILVLDEATSALDPMTEKKVDENIRRRGCTCIIVAHRLSTIRDCDEIIVLDKGKIVQRGTHEQLKNIDGHYANLIEAS
ncbi:MAG: NHLP family bacteriocin export ABC transporter peptidase/permease/ATPase subunit [Firmicutes bacterium]|nr:NHLP family bacteriocin export ABC transporter peptidase/permease/ATPase subunit [Bacillota bacterium]